MNNNKVVSQAVETPEQELARLREENAKLKAEQGPTIKISDKGGISVYGLGKFPVTLYRKNWLKLLGMSEAIQCFIETNREALDAVDARFDAEKQAKKKVAA